MGPVMNCNEYKVVEVEDLGEGCGDWMLLNEPDAVTLIIGRRGLSPQVIADAWAAYRKVMRLREGPRPHWLRAV